MRKFLSLLFFCSILNFSFGQFLEKLDFTLGGAVGAESILVLPKIGVNYKYFQYKSFESSAGLEVGVWTLFFVQYSVNVYNSFEIKLRRDANFSFRSPYFIFDNSLGFYHFPDPGGGRPNFQPYVHYTYTPKIGLSFGMFYFKIGHSFFLSDNYRDALDPNDFYSFNGFSGLNPNFECGMRFRFWK